MGELLRDNMETERRHSKDDGASTSSRQPAKSRREVPDILSWVQCFGIYTSIVVQTRPEKTQQLLAYQTMLLREARRCGGTGWQTYDTIFRQQVANNSTADWSKLNSSLYAVNFLANQNGRGKTCQHCLETDHLSSECALAPVKVDWASSRDSARDDAQTSRSRGERGERRGRGNRICFSWNDGRCAIPYCEYRHICAKCAGEHKAIHYTSWNRPPSHQREWGRSRWCDADLWRIVLYSWVVVGLRSALSIIGARSLILCLIITASDHLCIH